MTIEDGGSKKVKMRCGVLDDRKEVVVVGAVAGDFAEANGRGESESTLVQ